MKSAIAILISLLFLIILVVATSNDKIHAFQDFRSKTDLLGTQKYFYGDLYEMAYLPGFKLAAQEALKVKLNTKPSKRFINLYTLGDSYLASSLKSDTIFNHVKEYEFNRFEITHLDSWNSANFNVDTSKLNVLLIESVEGNIWWRLADTNFIYTKLKIVKPENDKSQTNTFSFDKAVNSFFNPIIETNLQYCLFDYSLLYPIKELKSIINYKIFDRLDKDVEISTNKKYLLSKPILNKDIAYSSFYKFEDAFIDKTVSSLNSINEKSKKIGFDKVYFTFIPNPVSLLDSTRGEYNHLIPRIQNHPNLKVDIIDIYTPFKKTDIQVYRNSDTHWNQDGFNMWVNLFNEKLDSLVVIK